MTDLVVRRLLVDMEAPVARRWCGDDAFRTAYFDALSMSFPVGEQFFIDAVRGAWKALPPDAQERHRAAVQGFVGQEATHRRLHGLYNAHLEARGLVNAWGPRAERRLERLRGTDPRHAIAITAAFEHFTAILSDWLLAHPHLLDGGDERLKTLWLWHSAEESEHKTVAFDLYRALGGDEAWRQRWFRRITAIFLTDLVRQTVDNLRRDGELWRVSTWRSAWRDLFGPQGMVRGVYGTWRDYRRADFHPAQHDTDRSSRWLAENATRFVPVRA